MYLKASIIGNSGIIRCCNHAQYDCLPVVTLCQCCQTFASIKINVTDMSDYLINTRKSFDNLAVDSRLLHEPITKDMLKHDPYTPESVDSHSPNPEKVENNDDEELSRRNSVTPEQLISRLEKIARSEHVFNNVNTTKNLSKITRSTSHNTNINGTPKEVFRTRAMSEIPRKLTIARLISTASVQSTLRLQSHHSSSDEEWFEFEHVNAKFKVDDKCDSLLKKDRELTMDVNENDMDDESLNKKRKADDDDDADDDKKNKCKLFCCCLM